MKSCYEFGEYAQRLLTVTHAVRYNPNCPSQFQVRLVHPNYCLLDLNLESPDRHDVIGYGTTLEQAARDAFVNLDQLKTKLQEKKK